MRRSLLLISLAWLSTNVWFACSSFKLPPLEFDGGLVLRDAGFDAGAPVVDAGLPLSLVCQTVVQRRCEYLARCGLIAEVPSSFNRCLTTFTSTWCGPGTWPARVRAPVGTLRYDPVQGSACADSFLTRSCEAWATEPDSCARMVQPNADLHERCYDGYAECTEGVCRGATCPRSCQPLGVDGETCRKNADCRPPLMCHLLTATPGLGLCGAPSAANGACERNADCVEGLACILGACRQLPGAGAACVSGQCDDSATCKDAAADGGVCVSRVDAGEPCKDASECVVGSVCLTDQAVCAPAQVLAAGSPCANPQRCPVGLVCVLSNADAGQADCAMPRTAGTPCLVSSDCAADLACVLADGGKVCGPRHAPGTTCVERRDCGAFATCADGVCRTLPTIGESCTLTQECVRGLCTHGFDGGSLCTELGAPGAACDTSAECASGECHDGRCAAACAP